MAPAQECVAEKIAATMTPKRVPFFAVSRAILIVAFDCDVGAASAPALEVLGDDERDGSRRDAEDRGELFG